MAPSGTSWTARPGHGLRSPGPATPLRTHLTMVNRIRYTCRNGMMPGPGRCRVVLPSLSTPTHRICRWLLVQLSRMIRPRPGPGHLAVAATIYSGTSWTVRQVNGLRPPIPVTHLRSVLVTAPISCMYRRGMMRVTGRYQAAMLLSLPRRFLIHRM